MYFDDAYSKVPRDEIEAKALKELMGLNIELPKARLLAILREEGGDPDCAAAKAFVEMRNQYKAERGENVSGDEEEKPQSNNNHQPSSSSAYDYNTSYENNNSYYNSATAYEQPKNYYDPTYVDPVKSKSSTNHHHHSLNPLANNGNDDDDDDNNNKKDKKMYFDGGSYDMTFDATVDENVRDAYDAEDGNYMLRVRSKEYENYGNNFSHYNIGKNDGYGDFGNREQSAEDDAEEKAAAEKRKFPGVFMKTFCHGGSLSNKTSYSARDGSYLGPYSFLNEGVRIIRLDNDDAHTQQVNVVDTSSLADDEFEALCEEWLDERYDVTEVPEMFHEGQDYAHAVAKNEHDLRLFDLFTQFEKTLREGFSLENCLTTFNNQNLKATYAYKKALGLLKPEELTDEDRSKGVVPVVPTKSDKIKTTGTARAHRTVGDQMHYNANVTRNVSSLARDFSVSIRLPRTCQITRVEIIHNSMLERRFDRFCDDLRRQGIAYNIGTGYHGSTEFAVQAIAETGFICPLEGKTTVAHKSGNNGFYGNGTYTASDPNVAFWYSQGSMMLIVKVARGRVFRCPGLMMGVDLQPGYDSHESPDGVEWVCYRTAQMLPIAIIHFDRQLYNYSTTVSTVTKTTIRGRERASILAELDRKAHGGVHLSNKDRKALNRVQNAQIQTKKNKKK